MDTHITLPYFAPPDKLPAPLPTVAEILASEQRMSSVRLRGPHPGVVRVGEHFIVKFGSDGRVPLREGENMLFVQQSTSLKLPTVYALFKDEATGLNFIIQEYIHGRVLGEYWENADGSDKEAVATQLRKYWDELRSIPSPGYYGGVWRQPTTEDIVTCRIVPEVPACETEEEWTEIMLQNAERSVSTGSSHRFAFYRRVFHSIFRGHDPVFTHGDPHPTNIIVRDDKTVVLIDWANSGWYPSYVEYCYASLMMSWWKNDLVVWIPRFLIEYVAELGWMMHHRTWMIYGGDME
jgi:hypothetical protein